MELTKKEFFERYAGTYDYDVIESYNIAEDRHRRMVHGRKLIRDAYNNATKVEVSAPPGTFVIWDCGKVELEVMAPTLQATIKKIECCIKEQEKYVKKAKEKVSSVKQKIRDSIDHSSYNNSYAYNFGRKIFGYHWPLFGPVRDLRTAEDIDKAIDHLQRLLLVSERIQNEIPDSITIGHWSLSLGDCVTWEYLSQEAIQKVLGRIEELQEEKTRREERDKAVEYMKSQERKDWVENLEPGDVVKFKKRCLTCSKMYSGPYDPVDDNQFFRKSGQAEIVKDWVKDYIQFESGYMLDMRTISEFCKKLEKGESK